MVLINVKVACSLRNSDTMCLESEIVALYTKRREYMGPWGSAKDHFIKLIWLGVEKSWGLVFFGNRG
jgi:hypothetical protein